MTRRAGSTVSLVVGLAFGSSIISSGITMMESGGVVEFVTAWEPRGSHAEVCRVVEMQLRRQRMLLS